MERSQEALIDNLKKEIYLTEDRLTSLTSQDIAKIEKLNADDWVHDYQESKVQLSVLKKQLEIAESTLKDLFKEENSSSI